MGTTSSQSSSKLSNESGNSAGSSEKAIQNTNDRINRGDSQTNRYWYNFTSNEISYVHPAASAIQAYRSYYAIKLQAMVRGRLERKTMQKIKMRRAIALISKTWIMKREHVIRSRKYRIKARLKATYIQACWRGYVCRKKLRAEKVHRLVSKGTFLVSFCVQFLKAFECTI